jgi:predicted ATPase/DNA-binding SARP family transcriptional activator
MAHLSLRVLGPLQVLIDDTPVATLESDKVRALLIYLAVEADHPHRRESLVGLLWPDYPEEVARHNLRQALFNLRQAIGDHAASPPYLLISRETLQFNRAGDFSLDLDQFNIIFQTCEKDRRRGLENPSIRAARLEEIAGLYRGEFLQGFFLEDSAEFEQWALVQREGLHQRALDAHGWLAGYYEQHGDFHAARRHAQRQLELDPWREEAHCQVMRALALDGQRTAALAQYETCRRVLAEELGVEPSATTRELVEQIRAGKLKAKDQSLSPTQTTLIYNLPAALTSFMGREQEMTDLDRLIGDPECRCLSLVGPGGIGKTRLALQIAERHRADFPHGVAFVPLAPVGSVEAAIPAIAGAIHLHFYGPNDPKVQLLNDLREKQMLLILDNVEHLLVEGPSQANIVELILGILQHAPGVKLLVTSREVLNLQEEWVFDVGGLAFPGTEQTDRLDEYAAVALFIQRARHASPGFAFNETHLAEIAHICRLVEGMPLAIELAATWLRMLSPAEIAQEIANSLDALSASVRDLPERHRSVRVVFDGSWRTLSAAEQQALSQLSVFRGGFNRQAAEQVAGASLPVLSTLVNRTLLRRTAAGRYELHELIRQYCATHLAADPEAHTAAQKRHYDCFLALAEAARAQIRGPEQRQWLERLEQDLDNIRAALAWSTDPDRHAAEFGLRLCAALGNFWDMHGHAGEGRRWLQAALALPAPSSAGDSPNANLEREAYVALRIKTLVASGGLAGIQGDYEAALAYEREALLLCQQSGNKTYTATCLSNLGNTESHLGNYAKALGLHEQALALRRELEDKPGIALSLVNMGFIVMRQGDYPAARAFLRECVSLRRELGDKFGIALALGNLGEVAIAEQDYASAQSLLEESLSLRREIGDERGIAFCLVRFANLERARGNDAKARALYRDGLILYRKVGDRRAIASALQESAELYANMGQTVPAVRLWSTADMLCQSLGSPIPPSYRLRYEQALARARGALGVETFQQAWAEGSAMTFDQALDALLSDSDA